MGKFLRPRAAFIVAFVVVFICYGSIFGLAGITLVDPWIVAISAWAVAAALHPFMRSLWIRWTGTANFLCNILCQMVAAGGLLLLLFYALNIGLASEESLHSEAATVERRYSETRYHRKRVGRNRTVRGEPYKVYYVDVALPGGWNKSLWISLEKYNRVRVGDTLDLPVIRGFFGIPVIRR